MNFLNDIQFLQNIMGVLVDRLGGTVIITQEDLDRIVSGTSFGSITQDNNIEIQIKLPRTDN